MSGEGLVTGRGQAPKEHLSIGHTLVVDIYSGDGYTGEFIW